MIESFGSTMRDLLASRRAWTKAELGCGIVEWIEAPASSPAGRRAGVTREVPVWLRRRKLDGMRSWSADPAREIPGAEAD